MVITDFMTRLWQVCRPQINTNNQTGMNWRLIVTHPYGWKIDKLEQAIDAAIVKPDHGNSTYTICFQTEAEATLIAMLDPRGNQGDHKSNRQPAAPHHRPGGQVDQVQDGETVVDIASGRINTQASITSLTEQAAPTSQIYGPSILNDSFMSLLGNKAAMLLWKPQTPDWFHRALKKWEQSLLPKLAPGSGSDLTFSVATEDFKKSTRITHNRWARRGELPIHSVELESMMEYHIEKAIAAIEKQIKGLRELGYTTSAVSQGAILYGLLLSEANRRSHPDGQNSNVTILIDNECIFLVRKGEIMPKYAFRRIPIKGNLMQRCLQRGDGCYKLNVYSTNGMGIITSDFFISWRQYQQEVVSNDVCVLEIRLHSEPSDGSLASLTRSAHVAVFVNGVKLGKATLSPQ
ncbi:hypothetical protein F5B18DRAFT_675135 [Nemania serpens]|nr:hypothetical protein F5B18DRAFT_675135 [Nemania serpens]